MNLLKLSHIKIQHKLGKVPIDLVHFLLKFIQIEKPNLSNFDSVEDSLVESSITEVVFSKENFSSQYKYFSLYRDT